MAPILPNLLDYCHICDHLLMPAKGQYLVKYAQEAYLIETPPLSAVRWNQKPGLDCMEQLRLHCRQQQPLCWPIGRHATGDYYQYPCMHACIRVHILSRSKRRQVSRPLQGMHVTRVLNVIRHISILQCLFMSLSVVVTSVVYAID